MSTPLENLTLASFESRLALKMQRLIESYGGNALVAPTMQEVPIQENQAAFDFYKQLMGNQFDVIVLMTGVATRTLISTLEAKYSKDEILQTLSTKAKIVVRGPKPQKVCNIHKIPIAATAAEPNTWQEVIQALQSHDLIKDKSIAILEYGLPNHQLIDELKQNAKLVSGIPVYKWALPDDLTPLTTTIHRIIAGDVNAALFTSATQVVHLMKVVGQLGLEASFRRRMAGVVIASIGPVNTEKLREYQLFVDIEATPNKMENLVEQVAHQAPEIAVRKQKRLQASWVQREQASELNAQDLEQTHNSSFMKALRREKNSQLPVWLMRQAGRYMAEYQMIRQKVDFVELCKNPDLVTEVTITAVERLGVDAAILFADILLVCEPLGQSLSYHEGQGPRLTPALDNLKDIENLNPVEVNESLAYVFKAVRQIRQSLHPKIPLIGFAGCPFTIASYMIEGGSSKDFKKTKDLMNHHPKAWQLLMEKLTTTLIDYLNHQVKAGANALQVFDSWVNALTPDEYEKNVLPYSTTLIQAIDSNTPVIHFGSFDNAKLPLQLKAGGQALGLHWQLDTDKALSIIKPELAIQGNMNPHLLFEKPKVFLAEAKKILEQIGSRPGYIFNLGHGILPKTPVDHVMALVDYVHDWEIET